MSEEASKDKKEDSARVGAGRSDAVREEEGENGGEQVAKRIKSGDERAASEASGMEGLREGREDGAHDGVWTYSREEVNHCPSIDKSGLDPKEVRRRRMAGAGHIVQLGNNCRTSVFATARACLLYHHFYQHQSLEHFDEQVVAMTALFLACKAESRHRSQGVTTYLRIPDLIRSSHEIVSSHKIARDSALFKEYMDNILFTERVLLASLGFRLDMPTPHDYAKTFFDMPGFHKLLDRLNTLLPSTLCLTRHPAQIVAAEVEQRRSRGDVELPSRWWTGLPGMRTLSTEDLHAINREVEGYLEEQKRLQTELGPEATFDRRSRTPRHTRHRGGAQRKPT